jgi:hypothetical protein
MKGLADRRCRPRRSGSSLQSGDLSCKILFATVMSRLAGRQLVAPAAESRRRSAPTTPHTAGTGEPRFGRRPGVLGVKALGPGSSCRTRQLTPQATESEIVMPAPPCVPPTRRRTLTVATLALLAATPALSAAATGSGGANSLAAQMRRLRTCESSNNYRTDSGNGYYGAYQFDLRTWHGLGMHGRPDRNSPRTQDRATRSLHAQRGWQPWPYCRRKEHLR